MDFGWCISIHALLAESDSALAPKQNPTEHFYPRSPCGERRFGPGVGGAQQRISIHALLAESDPWYISLEDWQTSLFLSTLSLRRATIIQEITVLAIAISIHALLAESDRFCPTCQWRRSVISIHALLAESDIICLSFFGKIIDFYPRSPCGERPSILHKILADWGFLSTLSLRRATSTGGESIHKLTHFYPRSPCGERQAGQLQQRNARYISIHALLAESDRDNTQDATPICISIHALLAESDPGT